MAENWVAMNLDDIIYGYLYRNSNYPADKYIIRFYRNKKKRDTAANRAKEIGGVRKFQFKLRKVLGESILESDYDENLRV